MAAGHASSATASPGTRSHDTATAADLADDSLSMAAWLDREGLDSPWLRWQVDYACRDDYGALSSETSAWAGLYYFAARDTDEPGPLTWPEGNGWIARRLIDRVGDRLHAGTVVHRIQRDGATWRVHTPEVTWLADTVIVSAPLLVASRIIEGMTPAMDVVYSPWLTANLVLDRQPRETSFPQAWDNVIYDSPGLGYVVANHQQLRRFVGSQSIWTYYRALATMTPVEGRRYLLSASWSDLRDLVMRDLARAHPDIDVCVTHMDIWRIGHAMVRPTPGFLSSPARRMSPPGLERLFIAHSDVSGLPLFEEAQYRGVVAADAALAAVGARVAR